MHRIIRSARGSRIPADVLWFYNLASCEVCVEVIGTLVVTRFPPGVVLLLPLFRSYSDVQASTTSPTWQPSLLRLALVRSGSPNIRPSALLPLAIPGATC